MNNVRANILSAGRGLAARVALVSAPSAHADHEDAHDGPTEGPARPVPDDIADPIEADDVWDSIGGL